MASALFEAEPSQALKSRRIAASTPCGGNQTYSTDFAPEPLHQCPAIQSSGGIGALSSPIAGWASVAAIKMPAFIQRTL
jgi:hypothetical protein